MIKGENGETNKYPSLLLTAYYYLLLFPLGSSPKLLQSQKSPLHPNT